MQLIIIKSVHADKLIINRFDSSSKTVESSVRYLHHLHVHNKKKDISLIFLHTYIKQVQQNK